MRLREHRKGNEPCGAWVEKGKAKKGMLVTKMATTSATGGFLSLTQALPEQALAQALRALIAGTAGLGESSIIHRWQQGVEATGEVDANTTWCQFGVTARTLYQQPELRHTGEGQGLGCLVLHDEVQVLISMYGPLATDTAQQLRDSLYVPQNRALLRPLGLAFVSAGTLEPVQEELGAGWRVRVDVPLVFRQATARQVAVRNLVGVVGGVVTDSPAVSGVGMGCAACRRKCALQVQG